MTAVVFILIAVLVAGSLQSVETAFSETFTNDGFARFAKILILISASVVRGDEFWLFKTKTGLNL